VAIRLVKSQHRFRNPQLLTYLVYYKGHWEPFVTPRSSNGTAPGEAAGESTFFLGVNRNKQSVTANLAASEGRALVRKLVDRADVVVTNVRWHVLQRSGEFNAETETTVSTKKG
jgi:hypothetical protein